MNATLNRRRLTVPERDFCVWTEGRLNAIEALTSGTEATLSITARGRTRIVRVAAEVDDRGKLASFRVRDESGIVTVDCSFAPSDWKCWQSTAGHQLHRAIYAGVKALGLL